VFVIGLILYETAGSTAVSLAASGTNYVTIVQQLSAQINTGYAFMVIGSMMIFPIAFACLIAYAVTLPLPNNLSSINSKPGHFIFIIPNTLCTTLNSFNFNWFFGTYFPFFNWFKFNLFK
jgi:hypothetical protein